MGRGPRPCPPSLLDKGKGEKRWEDEKDESEKKGGRPKGEDLKGSRLIY